MKLSTAYLKFSKKSKTCAFKFAVYVDIFQTYHSLAHHHIRGSHTQSRI